MSATGVVLWKRSHCKAVRRRDTVEVIVLVSHIFCIRNKLFLHKSKIIFVSTFVKVTNISEIYLIYISRLDSLIVYNIRQKDFEVL